MKTKSLKVNGTRKEMRKKVIEAFIKELPGTGNKDKCSKYRYNVEKTRNNTKIYLIRPANLNKGIDFTVHIEGAKFIRKRKAIDKPSHADIISDLIDKKIRNPKDYNKLKKVIKKIFKCQKTTIKDFTDYHFNTGQNIEAILKTLKWLFIEQDVTYWNWSGRQIKLHPVVKTIF